MQDVPPSAQPAVSEDAEMEDGVPENEEEEEEEEIEVQRVKIVRDSAIVSLSRRNHQKQKNICRTYLTGDSVARLNRHSCLIRVHR